MADVFISYSSRDSDYVRQLARHLQSQGFDVWFDDHIETGSSWSDTIFEAITDCAAFIVVMTPASLQSNWVEKECLYAERRRKPRFPLLLEGEEFPFLIDVQYTDVRDRQMPPDSYVALVREAVGERPTARPAEAPSAAPARRTGMAGLIGALAFIGLIVVVILLINVAGGAPGSSTATTSPPTVSSLPPTDIVGVTEPIAADSPVSGTLLDSSPERWYQFEASEGMKITILMEATGGTLDPYLELYGPGDSYLGYNDELNDNFDDASLDAGMMLTAPQSGVYRIRAMRFPAEGTDQPVTSGSYRLTLQLEPGN